MESSSLKERTESRALEQSTMTAAFQATAEDNPDRVALRTKGGEFEITWSEYARRVEHVASCLAGLGLGRGDTLALMMANRPEFHIVDAAAMHLGATAFSVYNTYTSDDIEFLCSDAQNRIVVCEAAFADTMLAVRDKADTVEHVVVVDGEPEGTRSLDALEPAPDFDFAAGWQTLEPEDVVTLIYTSGTTGNPKGVQMNHSNLLAAGRSFDEMIKFPDGGRVVSYLPMAHIAERMCSHYLPMMLAFSATCCPDARQIAAYLPEVRPSWFFSVPRVWEKIKAALEAGIAGEPDEQRKLSVGWALDVGTRRTRVIQAGEEVPAELEQEWAKADAMVLSKIRERIGLDQLEACNVGAAPSSPEVIEFFHAIGVPLAELWGMSETAGAGTCNRPDHVKIGTVGPPSPHCEIRLDEDGEVLIRGGTVTPGYRNLPEKNDETFTEEGWLRTGDIGQFDDEGFLKIVDRKKELIINASGKNMSPANIEAKVKASSPLIGQAVAIGDKRPYNTALIVLDPDGTPAFAREQGLSGTTPEELAEEPKVLEAIQAAVDSANEKMGRVEQVKRFKILPTDWEPGGEELTPTSKLKRKPIAEKYAREIDALYAG